MGHLRDLASTRLGTSVALPFVIIIGCYVGSAWAGTGWDSPFGFGIVVEDKPCDLLQEEIEKLRHENHRLLHFPPLNKVLHISIG